MFEAGVRAHFLASRAAAPLLMEHRERRPDRAHARLGLRHLPRKRPLRRRQGGDRTARLRHGRAFASVPGRGGRACSRPPRGLPRPPSISAAPLPPSPPTRTSSSQRLVHCSRRASSREYGFTDLDGTQLRLGGFRRKLAMTRVVARPGPELATLARSRHGPLPSRCERQRSGDVLVSVSRLEGPSRGGPRQPPGRSLR
jgi:hypothetical protein